VNQIRQRDGGTWMTFKPGALFAVNKIKTREVSSTGLKTIHISRNPEPASSLANYVCTRLHHDESDPDRYRAERRRLHITKKAKKILRFNIMVFW
jgi:hypothetical protein